jgi:hypothetical protein
MDVLAGLGLLGADNFYVEQYFGDEITGGTPDVAAVVGDKGVIFDIKFGIGVEVQANENLQLLSYAANLLTAHPELKTFDLVIWQPRIEDDQIKAWRVPVEAVKTFRDVEIPQIIQAVKDYESLNGGKQKEIYFSEGLHCQFCPRKLNCPKKVGPVRNILGKIEENENFSLTDDEIMSIIKSKEAIREVVRDSERLVDQKLRNGELSPDECEMKIVSKLGNRKWFEGVQEELVERFGSDVVENRKLKTPNQVKLELENRELWDEEAATFIDERLERKVGYKMVHADQKGDHVLPGSEDFEDFVE